MLLLIFFLNIEYRPFPFRPIVMCRVCVVVCGCVRLCVVVCVKSASKREVCCFIPQKINKEFFLY
jgi:hypothetical protein